MKVYEIVDRNQKAAVSALHHRNEAVLDVVKPYFTMSGRFFDGTLELPFVGQLPTPKEIVVQWFGFFDEILKEEREFFVGIMSLVPRRAVQPSPAKPAAKAA
jgi:hypothetical protein